MNLFSCTGDVIDEVDDVLFAIDGALLGKMPLDGKLSVTINCANHVAVRGPHRVLAARKP